MLKRLLGAKNIQALKSPARRHSSRLWRRRPISTSTPYKRASGARGCLKRAYLERDKVQGGDLPPCVLFGLERIPTVLCLRAR